MKHRVVVTGMGVVSPIGSTVAEFQDNLLQGRSGIGPITLFDPASLPTRIAGEVKPSGRTDCQSAPGGMKSRPGPQRDDALCSPNENFRDRKITFALEAARQAMADAAECGTAPGSLAGRRDAGLSLGIGLEMFSMEDLAAWRESGLIPGGSLRERLTFLQTPSDLCIHLIAKAYGLSKPPLTHISACAAGTDAIGAAFREIRSGRRRWMLAGGTDSMINPLGVGGFCKLRALSRANETPQQASRPFDRHRDGFVLGEGAGMLVLETIEDAQARDARMYAEIGGYGSSFDAHGISEPHPEGRGAWQAMSRALADAGLTADRVDCINAHGSATPKNDVVESLAIKRLLGPRRVPVVSTKSMIGHLIAAAGALEAIAAILGLRSGWLHPTINLDEPDPECDLDYVPHQARQYKHRCVLSNSFGFGGQNATVVLCHAGGLDD